MHYYIRSDCRSTARCRIMVAHVVRKRTTANTVRSEQQKKSKMMMSWTDVLGGIFSSTGYELSGIQKTKNDKRQKRMSQALTSLEGDLFTYRFRAFESKRTSKTDKPQRN